MKPWIDVAELRRAHLFAGMSDEHLQLMLRDAREVQLQRGEGLFGYGAPAECFYFLRTGQIKLFRLSRQGDEKIIEILRPGETFAEAVAFMGNEGRYPVSAEAITQACLLSFRQKTLLDLLRASPEACFGMLSSMSRRLHMLVNQTESLALQNATYRLVAYLLEHIPSGEASPGIQLTTPKSVIAARLAIQPETLSRILARLRHRGLIEVEGARISVPDIDSLRRLVHAPSQPQQSADGRHP